MQWQIETEVTDKVLVRLINFIAEEDSKENGGFEFLKDIEFHGCGLKAFVKVRLTIEGNYFLFQNYNLPSGNNLLETDEDFKARSKAIKNRYTRQVKNYKRVKEILGIY